MPVENKKIERDDSMLVRAQNKTQIRRPGSYLKQKSQHDQREGMGPRRRDWRQSIKLDGCLIKAKCPKLPVDARMNQIEITQNLMST
jgi:hypothetical protein